MDTKNGRIEEMTEAQAKAIGGKTMLTSAEHSAMLDHSDEERPCELALMRFVKSRKGLNAPHGTDVQNAFRMGYRAGAKDQGGTD